MKDVSYEILDLMEEYGADEAGIRAILEQNQDPALLAALSPVRENLVDWIGISREEQVLEIGSAYGALTGALAWKAGSVTVLDSRMEHLEVNKKRHSEMKNIIYQCGEPEDLEGQKFDWVFLAGPETREALQGIGLHSAAWNHQEEEKTYGAGRIRAAARLVKEGGHLAVAVSNSKALKLWAGGEADPDELSFSWMELKKIFADMGGIVEFYYPLPDYRLPSAVYSDRYLPVKGEIPNLFAEYEKPRYRLFSEEAAYDALCEGGGFPQFASAFFVIWEKPADDDEEKHAPVQQKRVPAKKRQTIFVKYNRTRKPEYQIRTSIVEESGARYVEKTALCLEGGLHIHSFQKKYEQLLGQTLPVQVLKPEFPEGENCVRFPFLEGESLAELLGRKIQEGNPVKDVLEDGLRQVFPAEENAEPFVSTPNFREIFGETPKLSDVSFHVSNVDGLFENLMVTDKGLFAMDYEWVFDFPIPAGYLKYRNLHYFYERFKNVFGWQEEAGFFRLFGIGEELQEIYGSMEEAFQSYVHGDSSQGYLKQYQQPITSFEDLKQEEAELFRARERILQLQAENEEKEQEIRKRTEVQRLSDNHIANLDAIIRDLRHEIDEMGKLLTYLNGHEAIVFKVWRKFKEAVGRRFPKGTRRRKVLEYAVNTVRHPVRYGRLYLTRSGRNRITGDFTIGSGYLEHGKLVFPKDPVNPPLVSIVIPVYNQIHYTYACLLSILEHTKDVSYEVIIADDVSTDATKELGKYTENLVISRNSVNQGFLRNCNQAAMQARGRYIMFLNNDTQVTEGWLSSLVNLIESDPTIGMVGSKLVYPDGRLQEAGGIIWSDGSGWNYGRLDDPDKAEYNYVKDVDYISGAAILLSVKLWKQIGGFDVRFAPAYCEDSDLAFEVRKAGYRVVYQPLSKIIHFEGVSNGTDVNGTGLKRYQVENSRKLAEKWAEEFKKQCVNNGNPNPFRARERSMGKPVILVVDHYVPTYDKDAGSKTTFQYLKMFQKMGYVVKFLGDNFLHEEPYSTTLQQMGIEILYGEEYQTKIWDWLKENGDEIAFAYLNRPHIASKYVDFIKENTNIKVIYYGHDLHFLRELREYELTGDLKKKRDSDYWKSVEFSMMYKAAVSYYPSNVEVEAIHKVDPSIPVKAITAYVYEKFLDKLQDDFEKREGLLFVGGFAHPPNADAVLWFAKEVFPLIRKELPDVKFYVVGSKVTEEIRALDSEESGIVIKGFVSEEELAALYASCRIVVVPLRYGAGVKGKVVEAIYNGAPIVTTFVGAEGIPQVEEVLEIADDPQPFADAVVRLYPDTDRLKVMCHQTQTYIKEHFSVEAAWKVIEEDFTR